MIEGGSYWDELANTGSGDGQMNCLEDENRRAVTHGSVGCAVNIIDEFVHAIGFFGWSIKGWKCHQSACQCVSSLDLGVDTLMSLSIIKWDSKC